MAKQKIRKGVSLEVVPEVVVEIDLLLITEVLPENPVVILHEPTTKEVYTYDNEGNYIGTTVAHECALESGVFHIPANSTELKPMPYKIGSIVRFSTANGIWIYVPEPVVEEVVAPDTEK